MVLLGLSPTNLGEVCTAIIVAILYCIVFRFTAPRQTLTCSNYGRRILSYHFIPLLESCGPTSLRKRLTSKAISYLSF